MSFFAVNFLNVSISALLVIYVFVCLALILLVLMQRPKQEGLGAAFGANMTDQMFGARTTNVLQKGTVYLGSLFFALTLLLAILMQKKNVVNSGLAKEAATAAAAPKEEVVKSLEEQLKQVDKTAPSSAATSESTPVDATNTDAAKPDAAKPDASKPADSKPIDAAKETGTVPSSKEPVKEQKDAPAKTEATPDSKPAGQ